MELNLVRPLLFFDIESTGLNIAADGIVELSFVKVSPGAEAPQVKTWKIKPWDYVRHCQIPMNPSASAVNGVKDEDLVDCPKFIEILPEAAQWLQGSDLAGFNSAKFDLPLLAEEIERVRDYCKERARDPRAREKAEAMLRCIEGLDLHESKMVDVQNIYHHMEPRNLRAAYRFYCGGKDFDNAHTAEADTLATYEVLKPSWTATASRPITARRRSRTMSTPCPRSGAGPGPSISPAGLSWMTTARPSSVSASTRARRRVKSISTNRPISPGLRTGNSPWIPSASSSA